MNIEHFFKTELSDTEAKKFLLSQFTFEKKDIKLFHKIVPITGIGLGIIIYLRYINYFDFNKQWYMAILMLMLGYFFITGLIEIFGKKEHTKVEKIIEIVEGNYDLLDSVNIKRIEKFDDYNNSLGKVFQLEFAFSDSYETYEPENFQFFEKFLEDPKLIEKNFVGTKIESFFKTFRSFNVLMPDKAVIEPFDEEEILTPENTQNDLLNEIDISNFEILKEYDIRTLKNLNLKTELKEEFSSLLIQFAKNHSINGQYDKELTNLVVNGGVKFTSIEKLFEIYKSDREKIEQLEKEIKLCLIN